MSPQQNCPSCYKPTTLTNLKRSYLRLCPRCHLAHVEAARAADARSLAALAKIDAEITRRLGAISLNCASL